MASGEGSPFLRVPTYKLQGSWVTAPPSISMGSYGKYTAYMPTATCVFMNKNHQNLEHSMIFRNRHIYEIYPVTRFYGKITGQCTLCTSLTDSAQL